MYARLSVEVLPNLIPPNSSILAAVSGGPDSVALAHLIWRYMRENVDQKIKLTITHVNHKVRKEAEDEAKLVKTMSEKWGVPFILHEFNSKEYASIAHKSFQEAAREWRYARWQEDMQHNSCSLLATAHHLGDQAETVLYRLIRGSGTAGLAGIYPAKDRIIRPLLSVTKEEIINYCRVEGLPYSIDKSNLEPVYVRNRIRLELLPQLKDNYNERIQEALGRTAELLRWDEEYIHSQVDQLYQKYCKKQNGQIIIDHEAWNEPQALLSRIIRKAAAVINDEPRGLEYKFIKKVMEEGRKSGWKQDLPGLKVEARRNGFFIFRRELEQEVDFESAKDIADDFKIELLLDHWNEIPELRLQVGIFGELVEGPDILWVTELDKRETFSLEKPLICRIRRPGDKMFFKRLGHKTIKKVFQDSNVPTARRKRIPLFTSGSTVLWIPGVCRSDSLIPTDELSERIYGIVSRA